MNKITFQAIVFIILTNLFVSCNKVSIKYSAKKKPLRIGILTFPRTLNPAYITDETSTIISNKVYDSLYYFDTTGLPVSRVIENEKIILKNKTLEIVIELKKNVFFSDGKNLNSTDVIETLKLLKDKKYFSPYRSYLNIIKKTEKYGDYRFRIIFKKKNANWKNYLTFKILNSNEIHNIDTEIFKLKLLTGSGPLKFEEIKRPSKIILSYNQYYKNKMKKSLYTQVIYSTILYPHNSPLKINNDEVDIVHLQPESIPIYNSNTEWQNKFRLLQYNKFGYTYLVFNLNLPHLSQNIRNIFYHFFYNKDFLVKFIQNKGEVVKSPFLLLNKGIQTSFLKIKHLKNEIAIKILTNTRSRVKKEFIIFLAKGLKKYNIKLEPLFLEHQLMLAKIKKNDFEIAVSNFMLDIDFDLKDILYSNAYFNYSGYNSLKMDKLLNEGLEEFRFEERKKIYLKANNVWTKDLPFIPLYNLHHYVGVSKRIKIPENITSLIGSSGDFLQNIEKWIFDDN